VLCQYILEYHNKTSFCSNICFQKIFVYSGVASYGALGHVPPSTSNNFIFSSLWSKSDSQLSKYCVVCKISWCRCQQLTALSIRTALVTKLLVRAVCCTRPWSSSRVPHDIISSFAPPHSGDATVCIHIGYHCADCSNFICRLTASIQQLLNQRQRMRSQFVWVFCWTTCEVHGAPRTHGRCCCHCWKNSRRQSLLRCFILRSFAALFDACCRNATTKRLELTTSKLTSLMTQLSLVGKVSLINYLLLN